MTKTQIKGSHLKFISLIVYFFILTFTKLKKQLGKTMSIIRQHAKLKEAREKSKSNKFEIDLVIESFDSTTNSTSGRIEEQKNRSEQKFTLSLVDIHEQN